ncbi:glycoside hydrolase family 26 protein [Geodermatophilus normandii]|nr:glycosyl hydrolase [Geodermatophilus normandii]
MLAGTLVVVVMAVAVALAVHPPLLSALAAPLLGDGRADASSTTPVLGGQTAEPTQAQVLSALPTDERRYFGVSVAEVAGAGDPSAAFTSAVGVAPTLQMFFGSFAGSFDVGAARRITAAGRLPMLTWEPFDHRTPTVNAFPLQAIAAGQFDVHLREEAARFASVDGPLVVRFGHEMNGDWYPWGITAPGNSAADYIAAYRHVHDVVTAAGAMNVVWMWSPNLIDAEPAVPLASVYPGDDVVDWVGLSGYITSATQTFANRMTPTLAQLDLAAPAKPVVLAETAVERTSNRAAQIRDLVEGVLSTPRFIGFVWFDVAKRADWSVDDDPAAAAALGEAVRAGGFGAGPHLVPARTRSAAPTPGR